MKRILIHLRTSLKILIILSIGFFLILSFVASIYKPMYEVILEGEIIGYTENKRALQEKINQYMKTGDNNKVAFVEVNKSPQYELCLLKKENETNDEEIFQKIIENGTSYYKFYTILKEQEEVYYVENFEQAEEVIAELKEKESTNIDSISYAVKYDTELKEFTSVENVVEELYEEPVVEVVLPKRNRYTATYNYNYTGSFGEDDEENSSVEELGISLIRPITDSYTITSLFGYRSRGTHTGLDIATQLGTDIHAAADGVVTYSGYKGSYGNLVIISHGNGIETYYAHCHALYVEEGESVSQGETIAAVGSTGNSTGPHLHLEIRIDGVPRNPQNYIY